MENTMHDRKTETSAKKPDLRDQPSTALKDTDVHSPVQEPQGKNFSDPQRTRSGPDIVKPGLGGQATGQTTRQ
jgi:hypothetical protein